MENIVWAVITECKCDGDDEFGSWFSLFKNYDDALVEYQNCIEEETEIMGGDEDDDNVCIDEGEEPNGGKWWSIELSNCWRFSKVYLRAMEVA